MEGDRAAVTLMAPLGPPSSTAMSGANLQQGRSISSQGGVGPNNETESSYFPPKAGKDVRSMSSASHIFGPRGSSLGPSGPPPGSFSSDLRLTNMKRSATPRLDLSGYADRDFAETDDIKESEKRQAEYRDKINKETKIKIGSENLLEALISKNAKQTKDQRLKVESELNSSNRKIAELKLQLDEEVERAKRPVTPNQGRLSATFRGSPLRLPSQLENFAEIDQDVDSLQTESPTYVLAEILQSLEAEGLQADYYVGKANSLVELFKRYPNLKYDLKWQIFGLRMQMMLLSDSREVIAAGYRVIRHAIADRDSLRTIRELHTDILVILSLVKESKASIEREQALKFLRAFLDVKDGVRELSNAVIRTVVSIAEHHEDRLRNIAILTLTEIMIRDPALVVNAGGIGPLIDSLEEGSYPGSESLVAAFLYMLDSPQQRRFLASGQELEAVFARFTDPLSAFEHEERLKAVLRSVSTALRTWPGLSSLARNGFASIYSLLLSLTHPVIHARDLVLDLLFDVLQIKPPSWTSSFLAGRRLTTYGRVANLKTEKTPQQSRSDPENIGNRASLVEHYNALLLRIFIRCGLIKALLDSIEDDIDFQLRRKTSLLLGEVLKLANRCLPDAKSSDLQVLPEMFMSASYDEGEDDLPANNMIYQVDSVNRTLQRSGLSGKTATATATDLQENPTVPRPADLGKPKLSVEMDNIQFRNLLVESQVLGTVNYLKWKWDLINDLIEGPLLNPKRLEEAIKETKFLKRLIGFYRPFKYRFSEARNTKPNQRYVRIGCTLMKNLLKTPEGAQYLSESKLLRQLAECLAQLDTMSGLTSSAPLFSAPRISETLTGGYFALLGALSSDSQGLIIIGRWKMINMFYRIIDLRDRDDLVQLLLSNMDFSIDSHLRVLLSKALTACSKPVRISSTKLLRPYATKEPNATSIDNSTSSIAEWAIRLLVTQLYDPDVEVSEVAVQLLEEACNRTHLLEYVVRCRPTLDHLGEIGAPLLLRFLSTSLGYRYLDGLDYITQEMDDWFLGRNDKYVTLVEASLDQALSNHVERSKSFADEPVHLQEFGTVPPHFYRELTRTKEGCRLLEDSGHFQAFVSTIQEFQSNTENAETMLKAKGCLWAVGNIGSMELGAPFIEDSDVVSWIIKIAETSEVMTMRGTAFFVLGLISRSLHGMEMLAERGWDVATNHLGRSLGYCLPPVLESLFSIDQSSAPSPLFHPAPSSTGMSKAVRDDDPSNARVLSLLVDLGNTVLTKRAASELHWIKTKTPSVFQALALFDKAMDILERHMFRLPVRRFVIDLFDRKMIRLIVLEEDSKQMTE